MPGWPMDGMAGALPPCAGGTTRGSSVTCAGSVWGAADHSRRQWLLQPSKFSRFPSSQDSCQESIMPSPQRGSMQLVRQRALGVSLFSAPLSHSSPALRMALPQKAEMSVQVLGSQERKASGGVMAGSQVSPRKRWRMPSSHAPSSRKHSGVHPSSARSLPSSHSSPWSSTKLPQVGRGRKRDSRGSTPYHTRYCVKAEEAELLKDRVTEEREEVNEREEMELWERFEAEEREDWEEAEKRDERDEREDREEGLLLWDWEERELRERLLAEDREDWDEAELVSEEVLLGLEEPEEREDAEEALEAEDCEEMEETEEAEDWENAEDREETDASDDREEMEDWEE